MIRKLLTDPIFVPEGDYDDEIQGWKNATVGVKIVILLDDGTYKTVPVVWNYSDFAKASPDKAAMLVKGLFENAVNVIGDIVDGV